MISTVGFACLQPMTSRAREKLASTPAPYGMIENMFRVALERSADFQCVSSCWDHQSWTFGSENVHLTSIGL